MTKKEIKTDDAPSAIGPYSQAIEVNGFLYCSGQVPLDPKTGKLVEGGIKDQTIRVMKNLEAVAVAAGAQLDDIIKTTIFLKDFETFTDVNSAYSEFLKPPYPARATVEVSRLPLDVGVEIEAIIKLP